MRRSRRRPPGARRPTAWIGPLCFGALALAFCLYTRIDPGHVALFTALGICLGYLFTLFPLLTFSGRAMLAPGRPANGNEAFRTTAFALLARRLHRHSPAARALEQAVGTAARLAGGAAAVGPATAIVQRELAAGHDLTARQATAAAHEVRAFLADPLGPALGPATAPSKGTP
ncbi:hypothetical protein GCM10009596_21630 [Arthrobacter rhombi]|uniref:hypothetical protein n=1 Tax=Arthrobacter rhombi TaxID=71253 RepID=UPI0031CE5B30